ncbi:MAG TPA: acyl-CoA thioesterase domain-containing protein, partial [Parvibaculum sp.]
MADAVEDLIQILDLEQIEVNLFRGHSPGVSWQRVFGGQVIGQALVAAYRTVEERVCHSMHAYFIRPGDPKIPILYEVDRSRDGKSFTTRRVVAIQHGKQIFNLAASFQTPEKGFEHQAGMPDVPAPEDLPSERDLRKAAEGRLPEHIAKHFARPRPIEIKPVNPQNYINPAPMEP